VFHTHWTRVVSAGGKLAVVTAALIAFAAGGPARAETVACILKGAGDQLEGTGDRQRWPHALLREARTRLEGRLR